MKQLISAMFDDYQAATKAVQRLKSAGIPSDDISIVGGSQEMRSGSAQLSSDEGSAAGTRGLSARIARVGTLRPFKRSGTIPAIMGWSRPPTLSEDWLDSA
jgi:hypothetical protein